jgi:hypothetical protein
MVRAMLLVMARVTMARECCFINRLMARGLMGGQKEAGSAGTINVPLPCSNVI